ncbi:MAG TPA: nuclear transport factor 2 family protein [Saprospiraceae bacterium]|nr:nuclear transport factor 2 family protein [Saprospiraceae bacterium]
MKAYLDSNSENYLHPSSRSVVKNALILLFFLCICSTLLQAQDHQMERVAIHKMLDEWNLAAAQANYQAYFDGFAEDGVFTGTDATERWDKQAFMVWAKPYFDRGKAWNFKALERHISFSPRGDFAWFDELLDTQMKICRGSGVLAREGDRWKIKQYILSTTIPNEKIDSVISIKAGIEEELIRQLKMKK